MGFEIIKCPICGKSFVPAANHGLTDYKRHFVCSPHCSEEARKKNEMKLKASIERDDHRADQEREKDRNRKKSKNRQIATTKKAKYQEPVLIFDEKGNFIKRSNSQREATKFTGCAESVVSAICNGSRESSNGFIFRRDKELNKTTKRYIY